MHRDPSSPSRRSQGRVLSALLLGLAATLPLASGASAHPHVWVSVETTVLVEQGAVVGLRHRWTFDEFYTAMAIQGLDANKDGVYSREELAELAKINMDGLKEFSFFTFPRLGDRALDLAPAQDYWLVHGPPPAGSKPVESPPAAVAAVDAVTRDAAPEPGLLSRLWNSIFGSPSGTTAAAATKSPSEAVKVLALEFTVPLKQPVLVEAPDFTVSVHDPSWFIAFELAGGEAVKLTGAPESCRIDLGDATKASADDASRIGDAFSGQFGGPASVNLSGTKLIRVNCGSKS